MRGIRVLVVDDNPDVRELIAAVLERAQAEVATAASADEALEVIKSKRPDVLLCDLHMPGIDGFELIHRVRAWERTGGAGAAIPAAAVSAYASLGRRLRHARDEFQAFLTKPVDPETLVRTVRELAQGSSP
ncbi:MAG TPA: response regulator [Vicinamibacteria bacterium]|nr:response regulator [Vicinamibacteria bacterium]